MISPDLVTEWLESCWRIRGQLHALRPHDPETAQRINDSCLAIERELQFVKVTPGCRSCMFFTGSWCTRHEGRPPQDFQEKGCERYEHAVIPF